MRASKGLKRGTRLALQHRKREKGKLKISDLIRQFAVGDKVMITPHPSYQFTLPMRRAYGQVGDITEQRGTCYVVSIKDGQKVKELILAPVHLRKMQ